MWILLYYAANETQNMSSSKSLILVVFYTLLMNHSYITTYDNTIITSVSLSINQSAIYKTEWFTLWTYTP